MWIQHFSMYDNSSTTVAEKLDAVVAALERAGERHWRLGALFEDDLGDKRGTPGRGASRIARDFPNLARFHNEARGEVLSVDGRTGHIYEGLTLAQARAILGQPQKYLLGSRAVMITGVSLLTGGAPPPPWSADSNYDTEYHNTQVWSGFGPRIVVSKGIIGVHKGAIEVYACLPVPPPQQTGRLQVSPELAAFCAGLGRCTRRAHTFWESPLATAAQPDPRIAGSLDARLELKFKRTAPPDPLEQPDRHEVEAALIAKGWKSRRLKWSDSTPRVVLMRSTPTGNQVLWHYRRVVLRSPLRSVRLTLSMDTPAAVSYAAELLLENESALVGHGHAWFASDDHDIDWVKGGLLRAVPDETWALGPLRDDGDATPAAKTASSSPEALVSVPAELVEAIETLLASRLSPKDQKRIDEVFGRHEPALVAQSLLVAAKSARSKPLERALGLLKTQLRLGRAALERFDPAVDAFLEASPEAAVVRDVAGVIGAKGRDDADGRRWVLGLIARLGQPKASAASRTFVRALVVNGLSPRGYQKDPLNPAFAAAALHVMMLERAKGAGTHRWELFRSLSCWDDGRAWPSVLIELASPPAKLPGQAYNGWAAWLLEEWLQRDHPDLAPWLERLGLPREGKDVARMHVVVLSPEELASLLEQEQGIVVALKGEA